MKKLLFILILITGCNGRLSDEQRKKMKEQMELHKIKKVSDAEITEAAYAAGRTLIRELQALGNDSLRIDSMIAAHEGRISLAIPGKATASALEEQLVEAYLSDPSSQAVDNIQKLRRGQTETDSILYSKPILTKMPDGSEKLEGVWNIWLSKKQLIIAMDK